MRAVVFAYHNMGIAGIRALLDHGFTIPMVLSHEDDPKENRWFGSVADFCRSRGIPVFTPADVNSAPWPDRIRTAAPDLLFSFYYRSMLKKEVLGIPRLGALNLHGSLLPKYRGRAPVNWVLVKGEAETGVTLHFMTEKPDAGDIVGQAAVPIAFDDTALTLFGKMESAASRLLDDLLPRIAREDIPRRGAATSADAGPRTGGSTGSGRRWRSTTSSAPSPVRTPGRSRTSRERGSRCGGRSLYGGRRGAPCLRGRSACRADRRTRWRGGAWRRLPHRGGPSSRRGTVGCNWRKSNGDRGRRRGRRSSTCSPAPRTGGFHEGADPRGERLHRPPPDGKDPEGNGLDGVRDGPLRRAAGEVGEPPPGRFRRGGHLDQQGVDRIPHQEGGHRPAAGGHRHPEGVCRAAPVGLRARFRGEPPDRPSGASLREADRLPFDLRGVRDVRRPGVRRGKIAAGPRTDRQGAVDLLLQQATAGPRDLGLRTAGTLLHPLPPLQLDRAAARLDRDRQGGELARGDAVHRQPV